MKADELARLVQSARCRVRGWQDAGNDSHRAVVASLVRAFDQSESAVLCEPSLARQTTRRPPDVVLVDLEAGVHVFEVKGIVPGNVVAIEGGGQFRIKYAAGGPQTVNPFTQVRNAMFDVRDATGRAYAECAPDGGELTLPFRCWVVLPRARRAAWLARWGEGAFCPPELLFADDLADAKALAVRLGAKSRAAAPGAPVDVHPLRQLQCVWRAFGDDSVLYIGADERKARKKQKAASQTAPSPQVAESVPSPAPTLGEQFDEAAEAYKALTDEQQRLSEQDWRGGPRLVRGVVGSGKTVVLANNLARRLARAAAAAEEKALPLPPDADDAPPAASPKRTPKAKAKATPPSEPAHPRRERVLAVCFNRLLAPFIRRRVDAAYRQRTGRPPPAGAVDVVAYNGLMYRLYRAGVWRYQPVKDGGDDAVAAARARQYLADLEHVRRHDPDRFGATVYDAIYVDEGQDFLEDDFRLLKALCRPPAGADSPGPDLYVFYDDAQNLFGRPRPSWRSVGLNVVGRSAVMIRCFRNTRPVVEAAFNVLYGTFAPPHAPVPPREFGNVHDLEKAGLIARGIDVDKAGRKAGGPWRVRFAPREGPPPRLTVADGPAKEAETLVARLRWLVGEQQVRPEDVLVLAYTNKRVAALADAVRADLSARALPSVAGVDVSTDNKDRMLCQRGRLTVSTVASAKGYDAQCVLLASANEFPADVGGRATLFVGCTRASEYLEVLASARSGLVGEFERAAQAAGETPG
jgi:hypothetical protein